MASRRSYGTGSLYPSENGRTWVGHWRSNGRQLKRTVGPIAAARQPYRPDPHAGRGEAARADLRG